VALAWRVRDHRNRWIHYYETTRDKVVRVKQRVTTADLDSFEADMRQALTEPLLCHHLPPTQTNPAAWAYYACSSDPTARPAMVLVAVSRRSGSFDVVTSAYFRAEVLPPARLHDTRIEVDNRLSRADRYLCGDPADIDPGFPLASSQLERLKRLRAEMTGSTE